MTATRPATSSRRHPAAVVTAALLLAGCGALTARPGPATAGPARVSPLRPLRTMLGDRWIGRGIAYGPFRDGQRPGGAAPGRAELREDLALLAGRWSLLRVYGSDGPTPELLALIDEERLPFKVLLGAWIAPEDGPASPGHAANRAQVEGAVRLANAYPDVVLAVVVGNETQVSWSDHRVEPAALVGWLRQARRGVAQPVSTADDFAFWLEPRSDAVAAEVDFVVNHAYAMWNGKRLDEALAFTQARHAEVAARHPGLPVVLGEAGWATTRHVEGEQARLIRGEASEAAQAAFHAAFAEWVERERITSTWFEAFDERWKGGPHPDEVEKHWGLFRADRTPKQAVAGPR
ncbi:MAG: hypothetical protein NDI82_04380 [Anaeromyxobacteraceae bacterium]|nr:hypothetical protein [Anaeromyxobacteraceae bacterium]